MQTSIYSDYVITPLIVNQVLNADTTCTEIDMKGYTDLMVAVDMGNSADTLSGSNYIELELEHSLTTTTGFEDCANADLVKYVTGTNTGTFGVIDAPAEDSTVFSTGYRGGRRFVDVKIAFTGTHSTGTPISVLAFRRPLVLPANAVTTQ